MIFETERLRARRLVADDGESMLAIYGDLETVRYVGDSEPLTLEQCRRWVEVTDANFQKRGYGMVALVEISSGELIGCAGLVHPDQQPEAEVKYAFRRDRWGLGYASEAVQALLDYARANWGIKEVIATVDARNLQSQSVLRKVGLGHASDRQEDDGSVTQIWASV